MDQPVAAAGVANGRYVPVLTAMLSAAHLFVVGGQFHQPDTERFGDLVDGSPAGAVQPAFDPGERRSGDTCLERELFLGDASLLPEPFQEAREDRVWWLAHFVNIPQS
jgi:hypothetical protein